MMMTKKSWILCFAALLVLALILEDVAVAQGRTDGTAEDEEDREVLKKAPEKSKKRRQRGHSFNAPFSDEKGIKFWDVGGSSAYHGDFVRLTPQKQSKTGYVWNSAVTEMKDWEALIEFKIEGKKNYGGDGFAFWFTEGAELVGPVFGSADYWKGLGIFFDTFNNDGKDGSPLITAQINDGTQKYDAGDDGKAAAVGSCVKDLRNLSKPSFARVTYKDNKLKLDIAMQPGDAFENCFSVDDVVLGVDKYFGITAHTGDVADSHDIYSFNVKDLSAEEIDLASVRKLYKKKLEEEHHKPEHFGDYTKEEFQSSVLSILHQIQGSTNLMEMSQIALGNVAQKTQESIKSGGAGGSVSKDIEESIRSIEASVIRLVDKGDSSSSGKDKGSLTAQIAAGFDDYNHKLVSQMETVLKGFQLRLAHERSAKQQQMTRHVDDLKQHVVKLEKAVKKSMGGPSSKSAAGGLGWTTMMAIYIGVVASVASLVMQIQANRQYNRDKII